MNDDNLVQYARSLYDAHGDKAEAEAAQRAAAARDTGNPSDAATWNMIRGHIAELRGARQD